MIRHIVFCDICGQEKEQTNHWFVAYTDNSDFHISGLNPSNSVNPGAKHLCGQNCMHKMLDEFLTSIEGAHTQPAGAAKAAK